jgi:hypothetical protein
MTSTRGDFLQAALPPSCYLTGKTTGHRPSGAAPFAQVQPVALTSRQGVRRSFWGAGPQGQAVGVLRQKARWQTPYMCLVPLASPAVSAMTEARGVATREVGTRLVTTVTTGSGKTGLVTVCALTGEAIYVFGPFRLHSAPDPLPTFFLLSAKTN